MSRLRVQIALAVVALLLPRAAAASAILIQTHAFDGATVPIGVTPFNDALGTLDEVHVSISGVLTVSGVAPPLPGAAPGSFQPYSYRVVVDQDFTGIGGDYFDFATPAVFHLDGFTAGTGGAFTHVAPFSYSFSFTETSDLAGFTFPAFSGPIIPPVQVDGRRADFTPGVSANLILLSHAAAGVPLNGLAPIVTMWGSQGVLSIEYRYTPAATPVPEPGTMGLVALGVMAVARRRLNRRA
jgi:hypothetical protein